MQKSLLKYLILASITITSCSIDLKTKELAKSELKGKSIILIDKIFNLTYVENHAVAFGFLGNISKKLRLTLIFLVTISITFAGFYMIWKMREKEFRILLPLFILLAGAFGNILDRAMNGYVTDFFDFHYTSQYSFPVFNVADVLINIGVILILIQFKDFNRIIDNLFNKTT
jgi:signal peptidase II